MKKIYKEEEINVNVPIIFNLINNIEEYPLFLPWCTRTEVTKELDNTQIGKIFISKSFISWNFSTRNITEKNKSITLSLIDGPSVKKLEKLIAKTFGKKYGLMVNSGSSANLLALASMELKKGSEVITPTLTFSTTVAPLYQLGLIPHFIDVGKNNFVANIDQIKKAINKKTKAIIIPNLLGNVPDWKKIKNI